MSAIPHLPHYADKFLYETLLRFKAELSTDMLHRWMLYGDRVGEIDHSQTTSMYGDPMLHNLYLAWRDLPNYKEDIESLDLPTKVRHACSIIALAFPSYFDAHGLGKDPRHWRQAVATLSSE